MIKIKKSEFIKFLKTINEMRSSHSRSFIENEGEEDFSPIDATGTVGANQLVHALPPVEDPEFEPGSTETLRGAMIKIANEVPNSQIENFYRDILKLFDKTIDKMPESENPFNPVTESVVRMLVEMTQEESENENKDEEQSNDEVSGDPFNFDTAGPGVYIDLSHVQNANSLISDMNNRAKQEDGEHVDTTVFEVEKCIESEVFQQLFSSDPLFKKSFADEVDLEIMSDGLDSIESLDYANPVLQSSEALENMMGSLGKAFLLAKLTVFEKIFGEKRSKDDIKMSAEVMADKPSIRKILAYDQVIPSQLHEFAVVSSYMTNTITREEAKKLMYDGFASLFSDSGIRFMRGYIRKYQKEIENGQLEVLLPQDKKIDLTQFDEYGAFDEDSKTFAVDPNIRKLFNYITLVKGGEKEDIANAAAFLYFNIARASYFMEKSRKANLPPEPVAQPNTRKKRVRLNPGNIFKGTLTKVDPKSNIVKGLIKDIIDDYINTLPDKQTQSEFLTAMVDLIVDEDGNVTEERSLELGQDIIQTSLAGKDLSALTVHESTIYSNCYYQISELLRTVKLKIQTSFENTSKPIYKPDELSFDWQFLSEDQRKSVNSMLEGIDLEIADILYRYIGQMVSSNEEVLKILNRSSREAGGNFTIDVPVVTFAYIAPFILANIWQKTLTDHWERYKPSKIAASVNIDPEAEIRKIEKYFKDKDDQWSEIAPFIGFSGTSGAKQYYEQQVAHRFAFLDRHFEGRYPTESGTYHTKIIETIYDRLSPFLNEGLENYVKILERAKEDESLSDEDREYYSDIFDLYVEYSSQMNEINDIIIDFEVFDVESMDSQDWIFDDEEELVPTDIRSKFNVLLRETIPGKALRLLSHDLMIAHPNKSESFMPELSKFVEYAAVEIMVADNELSLRGAQKESNRREVANEVKGYFSGKKVMPDFSKGGARAKDLVENYGFTYDMFLKYLQTLARFVDKMFARVMQSESAKDISFSEFGNNVDAYANKNIIKGSMHKTVKERLESLEESLQAFNDPNNMERVTNIIDNYFMDAYDETQLEDLYSKFNGVVDNVKQEYSEEIRNVKEIDNPKKKKSASNKLISKIKKEIIKRRKPIQKDALAVSKEMAKRKSQNAKRQGKLL